MDAGATNHGPEAVPLRSRRRGGGRGRWWSWVGPSRKVEEARRQAISDGGVSLGGSGTLADVGALLCCHAHRDEAGRVLALNGHAAPVWIGLSLGASGGLNRRAAPLDCGVSPRMSDGRASLSTNRLTACGAHYAGSTNG